MCKPLTYIFSPHIMLSELYWPKEIDVKSNVTNVQVLVFGSISDFQCVYLFLGHDLYILPCLLHSQWSSLVDLLAFKPAKDCRRQMRHIRWEVTMPSSTSKVFPSLMEFTYRPQYPHEIQSIIPANYLVDVIHNSCNEREMEFSIRPASDFNQ